MTHTAAAPAAGTPFLLNSTRFIVTAVRRLPGDKQGPKRVWGWPEDESARRGYRGYGLLVGTLDEWAAKYAGTAQ